MYEVQLAFKKKYGAIGDAHMALLETLGDSVRVSKGELHIFVAPVDLGIGLILLNNYAKSFKNSIRRVEIKQIEIER